MRGGWVVIQSQGLHPWANVYLEKDGNNLSWKFNGIDLPPSVANTEIGKGYIFPLDSIIEDSGTTFAILKTNDIDRVKFTFSQNLLKINSEGMSYF